MTEVLIKIFINSKNKENKNFFTKYFMRMLNLRLRLERIKCVLLARDKTGSKI